MELYKHQKEAIQKFENSNEIMLFFTMGTGKSATTLRIAQRKFINGDIKQLLIIAPNDVHNQWVTEQVPLWLQCPYEVTCFGGRGGTKKFLPQLTKNVLSIVSVNIETFSQDSKWKEISTWARKQPTMIVLDEATVIKNVDSKRTQTILTCFNDVIMKGKRIISSKKHPNCLVRCVLTGTPITNGPLDLWSIAEFVQPNFFGYNWWTFKSRYAMFTQLTLNNRNVPILLNENTWKAIKRCSDYPTAFNIFGCDQETYLTVKSQDSYKGPYKRAEELKEKLHKTAMFKDITECLDMPDKCYTTRLLQLNDEQARAYVTMKAQQIAVYQDTVVTALNKLSMATKLQQISSGFLYNQNVAVDEELPEDLKPNEVVWLGKSNPKLEALYRDVAESSKPLIILTRYTAEADKIYNDLSKQYSTLLYTGWKKTGNLEDFKNGDVDILIANTACIARGFNLQNACTILFYSNTFSMELREQAEARIFRSGQKNVCTYIDYCCKNTVDEDIMSALKVKKSMLEYFKTKDVT